MHVVYKQRYNSTIVQVYMKTESESDALEIAENMTYIDNSAMYWVDSELQQKASLSVIYAEDIADEIGE